MIIENNNKWAICTPTKTGTYSLQHTLINRLKVAHKLQYDKHDTEYNGKGKRYMMVRHPLERWASMYWFFVNLEERDASVFLKKYIGRGINIFAEEWISRVKNKANEPNTMYLDNYYDIYLKFKPDKFFKLEDGLQNVIEFLGYDIKVSRSNVTKDKCSWYETRNLLSEKNLNFIHQWAKPDIQFFKY